MQNKTAGAHPGVGACRVYVDAEFDESMKVQKGDNLPKPIVSLRPLIDTFVLFNFLELYIGFSVIAGILMALTCFWNYLDGVKAVMDVMGKGMAAAHVLCLSSGALSGFGTVVNATIATVMVTMLLTLFPGLA